MADPATLSVVAAGMQTGGAAGGMYSQLQAIDAQKKQIAYQQGLATNANEREYKQVAAKTEARIAASGLDISGSPILQLLDQAKQAELQKQTIKTSANFQAAMLNKQKQWTILSGLLNIGQSAASGGAGIGGTQTMGTTSSYTPTAAESQYGYGGKAGKGYYPG